MSTQELIKAGNQVMQINQPTGLDLHITSHGSDWLWAAFSCFGVLLLYNILMLNISKNKKLLFGVATIPVAFEFFAYFVMASDLGWAGVSQSLGHVHTDTSGPNPIRQVFYAKYVAWAFSFPFFLTLLEIASNEEEVVRFDAKFVIYTITQVCSSWMFVVSLLVGSVVHSTYKWGFFVFGVFGCIYAIATLFNSMVIIKNGKSSIIFIGMFSCLIWLLYLVAWGLCEGSNTLQPDSESVFYGIIDLFMFGFIPCIINSFIPVAGPLSLELPERIIEKHEIQTKFVSDSSRASADTVIQSKTPSPKPETA